MSQVRMGADKKWFDSVWPGVQGILSRWMNDMDDVDPSTKQHLGRSVSVLPSDELIPLSPKKMKFL